jgi:aspartate/methionine/tyrosine aminotransferase
MNALVRLPNLTQYERIGNNCELNLTDGHAHQFQDPAQRSIVRRLPDLYMESEQVHQHEIEAEFRRAFYQLAGQNSAVRHPWTMLSYSASMSIDIIAAFLSEAGMSVGLVQPCFDNLAALLRRRGVPLVRIPEGTVAGNRTGPRLYDLLSGSTGPDALFLTLPNNPTGFALGPAEFERLARMCAATDTILIIDWTFRFFEQYESWDQYAVLARTGVDYICVEDTGKTWPTLELKCSILATNARLYTALALPHEDMLLNVSPFVLRLLLAYLEDARSRGLDATVRHLVGVNRRALHRALRGSVLVVDRPDRTISVEWVRIESDTVRSLDVVALLDGVGVAILPGDHFYWDEPALGCDHVRFALSRDATLFAMACERLRTAVDSMPALRQVAVR